MEMAEKHSKAVELGQFADELGEGVENMKNALPDLKELAGKAKELKKDLPPPPEGGEGPKLEGGEEGELPPPPEGGENGEKSPFKDVFGDVDAGDEDLEDFENFRMPKFSFSGSIDNSGNPEKKKVGRPEGCEEEDECDWMCENFIENGVVQLEKAVLGGEPSDTTEIDEDMTEALNMDTLGLADEDETSRRLQSRNLQKRNLGKRILTSGSWDSDEGMSGVETDIDEDPSGAGAEVEEDLENEEDSEEDGESDSASQIFSSIFATLSVIFVALMAF